MIDDFVYDNTPEEDMAQLHGIHVHLNAIAAIRRSIPRGPSLSHCEECGEEIPEERRLAVSGCRRCVYCQALVE